jgi:hypothetical protein
MKFKKGDILEFKGVPTYAAKKGAKAICVSNDDYLHVEWIRNGDDNDQGNGGYHTEWFIKVEDVSTQKEDRILEENKKVMKFDFEKGKILLVEYFQSELERGEMYTLEAVKGLDNIEDICSEIDSFNHFRDTINLTTTKINRSKTLKGVFEELIDTDLEDDDETVLSFFIEGLK